MLPHWGALKGVLPDEVLTRPKAGFTPPIKEWASGVVQTYGHCLTGGVLCRSGFIEQHTVTQWMSNLQTLPWAQVFMLYKLTMLEMWYTHSMA